MGDHDQGILLAGLDGSNPLAFLAALGTLRTLTLTLSDRPVRMRWEQADGAWRPRIDGVSSHDQMITSIEDQFRKRVGHGAFEIGDNLNLPSEAFAKYVAQAANAASDSCHPDRGMADFLGAFGSEGCFDSKRIIDDTALRTMSGAGHQHFLKFIRDICAQTERNHLYRALFETWDYSDPGRGLNLRWDPEDDRRYALRWQNPSNDPNTTMRGANRLAIEALPLLPTMPTTRGGASTCFTGVGSRNTFFTWPVWAPPVSLEVARSLLAQIVHWVDHSNRHLAIGIAAVFRSQRITTGKFRNFTPAQAL